MPSLYEYNFWQKTYFWVTRKTLWKSSSISVFSVFYVSFHNQFSFDTVCTHITISHKNVCDINTKNKKHHPINGQWYVGLVDVVSAHTCVFCNKYLLKSRDFIKNMRDSIYLMLIGFLEFTMYMFYSLFKWRNLINNRITGWQDRFLFWQSLILSVSNLLLNSAKKTWMLSMSIIVWSE